MIRSLYSGVAGMTTQQKKMDVIGNNIANVSTYGFKSSRATFRDVYYQTTTAAAGPSAVQGGRNAVQIGYGSKLGSTDSQSIMATTGLSLDCAIAGEGYFQVMDAEGEVFYTKAGMLDIDADGNLVDVNGNFVLGVSGSNVTAGPSSDKIKISLPFVNAGSASASDNINEVPITISATSRNDSGNINFQFASSDDLPIGEKVSAVVTSTAIQITLNSNEVFASADEFQDAVNEAITAANNGIPHSAGEFTIEFGADDAFSTPLTGEQIISADFGVQSGSIDVPDVMQKAFSVTSVGDQFSYDEARDFTVTIDEEAGTCTFIAGGGTYSATVTKEQMATTGSVVMKRVPETDPNTGLVSNDYPGDTFVLTYPNWDNVLKYDGVTATAEEDAVPSTPSSNLGLGSGSFTLSGGTEGGLQTVADLTGISIASNGVIYGVHTILGTLELGRIDLATFDNTSGLDQVGSTYFAA